MDSAWKCCPFTRKTTLWDRNVAETNGFLYFSDAHLLGPPGTSWDLLGPLGTSWDLLGPPGTSWDLLGPPGASRDLLRPPGTSWEDPMDTLWIPPMDTSYGDLLGPPGISWEDPMDTLWIPYGYQISAVRVLCWDNFSLNMGTLGSDLMTVKMHVGERKNDIFFLSKCMLERETLLFFLIFSLR